MITDFIEKKVTCGMETIALSVLQPRISAEFLCTINILGGYEILNLCSSLLSGHFTASSIKFRRLI